MGQPLTEDQMREAIQTCADERVDIPGIIQPIGYLLGCSATDGTIHHASANCDAVFGAPAEDLLGQDLRALLGREIWHGMMNLSSMSDFAGKRHFVGRWTQDGKDYAVHCSGSGDSIVVEIEDEARPTTAPADLMREQAFLIGQIERCTTLEDLFDLSARLLRHITGFDRVKVIRFDEDWNGEVIAESRSPAIETMLGLHFPDTDIPAQARDIMAKLPLRLISDSRAEPIPLVSAPGQPPLDITYANSRGASPLHMTYLQNMDIAATMTLSIPLDDELWGYVSFHHRTPFVVSPDIRHVLLGFLPVLRLKVGLIRQANALVVARQVDELQTKVQKELESETELGDIVARVGPSICQVLNATGVVMTAGSQSFSYGDVPESSVIAELNSVTAAEPRRALTSDCLTETIPGHASRLNGFAGALVTLHEGDRSLQVFRREISQSVSWAGNPTKTVETVDGNLRLEPRRSFSAYLQMVEGRSQAWTREDRHTMRQLWPLLGAAERRAFMADLNRQQTLMINELNHRVRNILSLVKSVSSQARRSGGSLESYSNALESRIHALAAAHDIGAGQARTSVSIKQIIKLEAEPFEEGEKTRIRVHGTDASVRAEAAPIFALVIHELVTNAVKYGSLSVPKGTVDVKLQRYSEGIQLTWTELGGPKVAEPERRGFGTTLILQAVPYEMGGTSELEFLVDGVRARVELPKSALGEDNVARTDGAVPSEPVAEAGATTLRNGLILVLEDNFMIAEGMRAELEDAGFVNIEMVSSAESAMEFIERDTPVLALLDVNLGHGKTSERVASELLLRHVPVVFVTGYGEQNTLPAHLRGLPVLTKPVITRDLLAAVNAAL